MEFKMKALIVASVLLAGCATVPPASITEQLAGKSKVDRIALLNSECVSIFGKSHSTPAPIKKYGNVKYRRHKIETRNLCQLMMAAANGEKGGLMANELFSNCQHEQVWGGKVYPARNKRHIEQKNNMCKAFYQEILK